MGAVMPFPFGDGALFASSDCSSTEFYFLYPVGVHGKISQIMDTMVEKFNRLHSDIRVIPVYGGTYDSTESKILDRIYRGSPPGTFLTINTAMRSFLAINSLEDITDLAKAEGIFDDFIPAFRKTAMDKGRLYGCPFQASTPVLYYNKDMFEKAGLDPDIPPATWDDLRRYSKILTLRKKDSVIRWGHIISGGWHDWIFESFVRQNGFIFWKPDKVMFDAPQSIDALIFWTKMGLEDKIMPTHSTWTSGPHDFLSKKTAMLYHSTGSLTALRTKADFPLGVAFMPKHITYGATIGGGPMWMYKKLSDKQKEAVWTFMKWMTSTDSQVFWSQKTGYLATRISSWKTEKMKAYLKAVPQAGVALDQADYAGAFLQVPGYHRVREVLKSCIDASMSGILTPAEALKRANRIANRTIKRVIKNFKSAYG